MAYIGESDNQKSLNAMPQLCFPHYKRGEFDALHEVLEFLGAETYSTSRYALRDIVLYTPTYRNHLRRHGVEDLIVRLMEEAPALKSEPVLLHRLRSWAEAYPVADYDIRCYNIADKVTILGHTFKGLSDIRKHTECITCQTIPEQEYAPKKGKKRCEGVHIGCFFERFSYWVNRSDDARNCECFIFRTHPITESEIYNTLCSPHTIEHLRDTEGIDKEWLPLAYYPGEGEYMFVVTKREE